MEVDDAHLFPGFLTPVLTQLFFPKPSTTFLTCFCRDERRKYAGKKSRLNRGSKSQPPGHESDMLNTEPIGQGRLILKQWDNVPRKNFISVALDIPIPFYNDEISAKAMCNTRPEKDRTPTP